VDFPILSVIVLLPAVGGLVVLALPRRRPRWCSPGGGLSLLVLGAACWLGASFEVGPGGFQFEEQVTWYEPWGVSYHLG